MTTLKDKHLAEEIADEIDSDKFHNAVARALADIKGIPFTEEFRRATVADLRASSRVEWRQRTDD